MTLISAQAVGPEKAIVLGVPVDVISFTGAQDRLLAWGHARESRYVVLANVHVVVTASTEPDFGAVVAAADMATPDGAPVAWMLRKLGHAGQGRVSGPDLTQPLARVWAAALAPMRKFCFAQSHRWLYACRWTVAIYELNR